MERKARRKDGLSAVLTQAMSAAKSVRAQRDRLLQLRRRLQGLNPGDDDDAAEVKEVASGLCRVYFRGLEYASRYLRSCLLIAADCGVRLQLDPALVIIPAEQLYGVLLTQRLPTRPTTLTEAFSRIEAALCAVKLPEEHHVPRCIELLVGVRPHPAAGEPLPFCGLAGYPDDPIAAAHEHLARYGLPFPMPAPAAATEPTSAAATDVEPPQPAPAAATELTSAAATDVEPPQPATRIDLDQALSYLYRACSLTSLAIKYIDVAAAVFSTFLEPKEVADAVECADQYTYIPEDGLGPYPSWD